MIKVLTKDVKAIVKATFPDYKKRDVYIDVSEKVTFSNLNWGGGSKNVYRACTVDGRALPSAVDMGQPAPWNNPFEGKSIDLPIGAVIVQGGTFCGKPGTLFIHVHPQNMPKLLTA